jgi:hypothetical protein
MLEYKLGVSILGRVFDARNEWQCESDVTALWQQAATILPKQATVPHEQKQPPFDPDLVDALVAAIRRENSRAGAEYARDYPDTGHACLASRENPLPVSGGAPARNRVAQCRGTLAVAFRGCQPTIDWTHYVAVAERVVLNLGYHSLLGSVDLTKLSHSLTELHLSYNQLTGTLDLTQLPPSLQMLWLNSNQLSGSVDLTQLPQSLLQLHLGDNQLSGGVDLTKLPRSLQVLRLGENQFSGSVDLTQLPQSLKWLSLRENQLSGSIDLTKLPQSLQELSLDNNKFSGAVQRSMLPRSLVLSAADSGLSGIDERQSRCVCQ